MRNWKAEDEIEGNDSDDGETESTAEVNYSGKIAINQGVGHYQLNFDKLFIYMPLDIYIF